MARFFREYNYNVVISDLKEENLIKAKEELDKISSEARVAYKVCNVSNLSELEALMKFSISEFNKVDIWINNAGVNQPQKAIWELSESEINTVIDVDLKGAIYGSKVAMEEMSKNHSGAIYNIEGYGSNDAHMLGLNMYGTSKPFFILHSLPFMRYIAISCHFLQLRFYTHFTSYCLLLLRFTS